MYLCYCFSSPVIGDCFVSICKELVSGSPIILVITRTRSVPLCGYFVLLYCSMLEKAIAPHSSTLAWKTPWMEEPGRLQSMGS